MLAHSPRAHTYEASAISFLRASPLSPGAGFAGLSRLPARIRGPAFRQPGRGPTPQRVISSAMATPGRANSRPARAALGFRVTLARVRPAAGKRPLLRPGRGPLALLDSSTVSASSSSVNPGLGVKPCRFRVAHLRVPARCRCAVWLGPGRGPQPLRDSTSIPASSGRAQPGHRPSTSQAESAQVLVRPQPAPSPRGLRHWHRVGLGAETLGGGKRTLY